MGTAKVVRPLEQSVSESHHNYLCCLWHFIRNVFIRPKSFVWEERRQLPTFGTIWGFLLFPFFFPLKLNV